MPHKANAGRRHHIPRPKRRITNWAEYDAALRRRDKPIRYREPSVLNDVDKQFAAYFIVIISFCVHITSSFVNICTIDVDCVILMKKKRCWRLNPRTPGDFLVPPTVSRGVLNASNGDLICTNRNTESIALLAALIPTPLFLPDGSKALDLLGPRPQ